MQAATMTTTGAPVPQPIAGDWQLQPSPDNFARLQQVVADLDAVHNPRTDNALRLQAQSVHVPRRVLEGFAADLLWAETGPGA